MILQTKILHAKYPTMKYIFLGTNNNGGLIHFVIVLTKAKQI